MEPERGLVALSRDMCLDLLRRESVGRVVFTERALPAVLPVSFAVLGEDVVICTDGSGRIARAAQAGVLAFEVDDIDPRTRTGWSVVLTGTAQFVTDAGELAAAEAALDPWVPSPHDIVIRIPSTLVTGRELVQWREAEAAG